MSALPIQIASAGDRGVFGRPVHADLAYDDLPHDFTEEGFDAFLRWAHEHGASDLAIQTNDMIYAHMQGLWVPVVRRRIEHNEIEALLAWKYNDSAPARLDGGEPLDFRMKAVLSRDEVIAFRANATRCRVGAIERGISVTARAIPGLPPRWEQLGIEPAITDAFFPRYGLVLVVGTTGSGKSTLLASSIARRQCNAAEPVRVGTFEDPIEYSYGELGFGAMPLVSQVEIGVGADLRDFSMAGPNAMRRKFDVIVTGEMRDAESIRAGLEMAETGHAVLATLHVDRPAQAVDRIVSFFGPTEQAAVASKLRGALRLVVAQKLARNTRGTRTAFRSWMTFDRDAKNRMSAVPYSEWERMLDGLGTQRGCSFESGAFPALADGLITFETFLEVTGMTPDEGRAYCTGRGLHGCQLA